MMSPVELEGVLFLAESGGGIPETDVHGLRADQALEDVERLLHGAFARGERAARVIHGKGEGRLRDMLHRAFATHSLVAGYRETSSGGATVIALIER